MAETEKRMYFDQEIIDRVKQIDLLTYLREHDPRIVKEMMGT